MRVSYEKVLSNIKKVNRPVLLVAVSKTKPIEQITECYNMGQVDFGENYVSELVEKSRKLVGLVDVKWHFIGVLQSNKVKTLVENAVNLHCVQSVTSIKLADALNRYAKKELKVYVQVNTSMEGAKNGITTKAEMLGVVEHIREKCANLFFEGLMTTGTPNKDNSVDFETLCEYKRFLEEKNIITKLSMGMSGDYEKAMEYGSDCVRIGSLIFGARDYTRKSG